MSNPVVSGRDLVLDLVNEVNALAIPLHIGNVNVLGKVYGHVSPRNISTNVVALPNSEYEGSVLVNIKRICLVELFGNLIPRIRGVGANTLREMLPWVSKELGIHLPAEEFVDVKFHWLSDDEQVYINIVSNPDSLVYYGSAQIHFTRRRMTLEEGLSNYQPMGLLHPNATFEGHVKNKVSVTNVTWANDFTDHYDDIRRHPTHNILGNPTGCASLMRTKFGFNNWPSGHSNETFDFPTESVPEANKDYDRVVIQYLYDGTANKTRPYEGIAYFHYNEL